MRNGFSYGLAYTWSKTMSASPSPYWPDKYRNYGASGIPHILTINYVYDVPKLGKKLNLRPLGWVTDNWTISGITSCRKATGGCPRQAAAISPERLLRTPLR